MMGLINGAKAPQVAADQEGLLIVAQALSDHPNDKQEGLPTLNALPAEIGKMEAVTTLPARGRMNDGNGLPLPHHCIGPL